MEEGARGEFLETISKSIIEGHKLKILYEIQVAVNSRIIEQFESKIRQNEKEKCIKAVLKISSVDGEPVEQEIVIHAIMES